jgi:hypothetical protein
MSALVTGAVTGAVTRPSPGEPQKSSGVTGVTVFPEQEAAELPALHTAVLLKRIARYIQRFIVLSDEQAALIALWVLHAETIGAWEHSPRLFVAAPEPDCGKTTLCGVIGALLGVEVYSHMSKASIYRTLEEERYKTLIMDELDTYLTGEEKQTGGILNSGWSRTGSYIKRAEEIPNGGWKPRSFCTFGPLVLCKIGASLPHPALATRCLLILLRKRKATEQIERFKAPREGQPGDTRLADLRSDIALWAAANLPELSKAEPDAAGLQNRLADNWRPLFAIADTAGGKWSKRTRQIAMNLASLIKPEKVHVLLADIGALALSGEAISSEELANRLRELPERPWRTAKDLQKEIARLLEPYAIKPKPRRIEGVQLRGYLVAELRDAIERYGR